MTEKDLIYLGFKRVDVTAKESGSPNDWYYYTYDFTKDLIIGGLFLISCDNEEAKREDGLWFVEIFDVDGIRFTNVENLEKLIWLIENAQVK